MNLTKTQIASMTLTQYIDALNARYPDSAFKLTDNVEHWNSMDVYTATELEEYLFWCEYSDAHKEAYGVRPRGIISHADAERSLQCLYDTIHAQAEMDAYYEMQYEVIDELLAPEFERDLFKGMVRGMSIVEEEVVL